MCVCVCVCYKSHIALSVAFASRILHILFFFWGEHHPPRYYLYSARFCCAKGCCVGQHMKHPSESLRFFILVNFAAVSRQKDNHFKQTVASRFKMTFSARWLEIDSHLGWNALFFFFTTAAVAFLAEYT